MSYDGLKEIDKEIFLYIACFFNHKNQETIIEILDCLKLHAKIGLSVLIDKSLIKVYKKQLWMHDLLQEMGRDIVRQESPKAPGKRSRLWLYEDIDNVLTNNTGTKKVQGMVVELPSTKDVDWDLEAFSKMTNLKLLIIDSVHFEHDLKHLPNDLIFLDWRKYPSKSLPSSFESTTLVKLCMNCSYIERLWEGTKNFQNLKFIDLNKSQNLIETPDFSNVPDLVKLDLEDCTDLCTVHPSIGFLERLTILNLKGCKNLINLPENFAMESLDILIFSGCSKVRRIPEFGENMERVSELYLDGTAITNLPTSIGNLTGLASLSVRDCKNLMSLPHTFFNMKSLENLDLSGCIKLRELLENLGMTKSVEELDESGTSTRLMLSSYAISNFLCQCFGAIEPRIPNPMCTVSTSLSGLTSLTKLDLRDCNLNVIPNDICCLSCLKYLDLSENNFGCLPENIAQLSFLRSMCVENCTSLQSLPKLPLNIGYINGYGCTSLETVPDLLEPNSLIERRLYLSNCSNLANNQGFIDMFLAGIGKLFQVPLSAFHSLSVFFPSLRSKHHALSTAQFRGGNMVPYMCYMYDIVAPGSEIPEWFIHRSMDNSVKINEPSHLYNEFIGIAVCVVFCSPPQEKLKDNSLSCWLTANGKEMSSAPSICDIDVLSDHIWLLYLLPNFYHHEEIKSLSESDANGFNQISIYFGGLGVVVKKCGLRMVYKRDIEEFNRTMAQSSKNNNTTYDLHYTLDNLKVVVKERNEGLHGAFSNLTVVVESNEVRQTHDDCDEAGPIEERSSNDVPNPKRIERITELMDQGLLLADKSGFPVFTEALPKLSFC